MRPCKLHLGREVSIYAFCGTLAAKVILINCENVFPSGERPVWPDVRRLPGYFTDCFLYLWRHRQEVVKGYLYFAVHNRCLSCLRSRKSLQKTKDEIEQLMSLRRSIEKICVNLRRLINTLFT